MAESGYWRGHLFAGDLESAAGLLLVVTLPDDMTQSIACEVRCESEAEYASVTRLMGTGDVSIRGHRSDVAGDVVEFLEIDGAHIRQATAPSHGSEHKQWLATIECGNTLLRIPLRTEEPDKSKGLSWVYVTEHPYLAITGMDKPQQDGSLIAAEPFDDLLIEFVLDKIGATAKFARVYDWTNEKHTITRTARLAVKIPGVDMAADASLRAAVYAQVDDFLLLAGLATGVFAQSVGFDSSGANQACRGYRGDRSLQRDADADNSFNDTVVRRNLLQTFWSTAYQQFRASPYRREIRTCLHALRASERAYLEPAFLTNFSVLELLLNRHRERSGLNLVLDADSFKDVRKVLSDRISEMTLLEKTERRDLHRNLALLNRVPIGEVFENFVKEFNIDLTDLWPVVMPNSQGLLAVRNLLVHGATVTTDIRFQKALSLANCHLCQ